MAKITYHFVIMQNINKNKHFVAQTNRVYNNFAYTNKSIHFASQQPLSVIQIRRFIYLKVYSRIPNLNHSSTQFDHKVTFSNTQTHKPFCIQFTWEWRSWFVYNVQYAICIQIKNMKIIHAKTLNAIKSSFRFIFACMIYGMQQVSWSCRERECHETIINIFISGTGSGSVRDLSAQCKLMQLWFHRLCGMCIYVLCGEYIES